MIVYSAGIAWAVTGGLSITSAAQASALLLTALVTSCILSKRAGEFGSLLGGWLEAGALLFLLWMVPSKVEMLWLAVAPMAVLTRVSPWAASLAALSAGLVMTASGLQGRTLHAETAPALAAFVACLVLAPLLFGSPVPQDSPKEPTEEPPSDSQLAAENESLRETEREARRAYRELVGLHQQLRSAHDRLACAYRMTRAAAEEEVPAQKLLDEVVALTGASAGSLWLVDTEGAVLKVRAVSGPRVLRTDHLTVATAVELLDKVKREVPRISPRLFAGPTSRMEEVVIREGERFVGLLTLRPHRKPIEPWLLAEVSRVLPEAVRLILRSEAMAEKVAFAEAKVQATDLIASTDPPGGVAARALELMRRFLDAEHWSLWILRDRKPECLAVRGRLVDVEALVDFPEGDFAAWVVSDRVLCSGEAGSDGTLRSEKATRYRVRSFLAVPLASGGKAVGALFAMHSLPNMFAHSGRAPILRLSSPLARALELAEIRNRPLALVRLDPRTGALTYESFIDRLDEELGKGRSTALVRLVAGARCDAERSEALGRAIAEALAHRGFTTAVGEREFLACLPDTTRNQAEAVAAFIAGRFPELEIATRVAVVGEDGDSRHRLIEALA